MNYQTYYPHLKLATPFDSNTSNISCISLRLQQLQAAVINIINRHCHKLSGAILNGQPMTAAQRRQAVEN